MTALRSSKGTGPPPQAGAPASGGLSLTPVDLPQGRAATAPVIAGALLWARYSYPPNELGYCGPPDSRLLLDYASHQVVDPGLEQHLKGFAGAYPYMEFIARDSGIGDPFDRRVAEAYWVGNSILEKIDTRHFGNSLEERFKRRAGGQWQFLAEAVPIGARPHHSFHVFGVYPWVGRLRGEKGPIALEVLDRCRIRWARVVSVAGDQVVVKFRPLLFDGARLSIGEPQVETVQRALTGVGFLGDLEPGEWVSCHWHWVCDRLSPLQLANLRRFTLEQLEITNERVAHPGAAMNLGSTLREF